MDQTPETTRESGAHASLEDRVTALEMLLQHLMLVLEAEPMFRASALDQWLLTVAERMSAHRSATPAQITALDQLRQRVMG